MIEYFSLLSAIWTAKGNRGNRVRSLLRGAWWFVRSRLQSKPYCLDIFSSRRIWCYPGGFISRTIMLFSEWSEYDSLKFIQSFLAPGDKFLDIGANVGLFSLLASETVSSTAIYCIEPGTTQRERLEENFALNGILGVHLFPYAVGEVETSVNFTREDAVSHIIAPGSDAIGAEIVEIKRLDRLLPRTEFQLTKLDVEGYELATLRGASGLIEAGSLPVILFELNGSSGRFGIRDSEILDFLTSAGYRCGIYKHDETVITFSDRVWGDVLAFTEVGESLIRSRIPGIRIE